MWVRARIENITFYSEFQTKSSAVTKIFDFFHFQSYGPEKIILLNNLQKAGLFEPIAQKTKEESKSGLSKSLFKKKVLLKILFFKKTAEFTSKLVQQFTRRSKTNSYKNAIKKLNIVKFK